MELWPRDNCDPVSSHQEKDSRSPDLYVGDHHNRVCLLLETAVSFVWSFCFPLTVETIRVLKFMPNTMFNGPNVNIKKQSSTQRREMNKKLKNKVITKAWTPKEGIHITSEKARGREEKGRKEGERGRGRQHGIFRESSFSLVLLVFIFWFWCRGEEGWMLSQGQLFVPPRRSRMHIVNSNRSLESWQPDDTHRFHRDRCHF